MFDNFENLIKNSIDIMQTILQTFFVKKNLYKKFENHPSKFLATSLILSNFKLL